MTGVPEVPGHAIQTLTAELTEVQFLGRTGRSRSYAVSLLCACGNRYPGVVTSDLSGVVDVGVQMFHSHLSSVAAVE